MSTAKDMGPARSPTVLLTPRPFSAKVDAHWLTACSLAPAHSIISINIQNIFCFARSFMVSPFSPSSISGAIGTFVNTRLLQSGTSAQITARIFQL